MFDSGHGDSKIETRKLLLEEVRNKKGSAA